MYNIKADISKNRLYVTLTGYFNKNEMKDCTDKTIEEAKKLKKGYDVITDISQFKPVGQDTLNEVERGQAFFESSGKRYGIRVTGKTVLTDMQFSRIGKSVGYVPDSVENLAEAEKILDSRK